MHTSIRIFTLPSSLASPERVMSLSYVCFVWRQGAVATLITMPLDVMKTRVMNAAPGTYKVRPTTSQADCWRQSIVFSQTISLLIWHFTAFLDLMCATMLISTVHTLKFIGCARALFNSYARVVRHWSTMSLPSIPHHCCFEILRFKVFA